MSGEHSSRLLNFSPDGRLYQIEYSLDAIKFGSNSIGIKNNYGALILVENSKESELIENKSFSKIITFNKKLGCSVSGLTSDARFLIDKTFNYIENNFFIFNSVPNVENCAKKIRDLISFSSFPENGNFISSRPFGLAFMIVGLDCTEVKLFLVDPSGEYNSQNICALGGGHRESLFILNEGYRKKMPLIETQQFALKVLRAVLRQNIEKSEIEMGSMEKLQRTFLHSWIDKTLINTL